MADPSPARRGRPCPVCGQPGCNRFPDLPSDASNPFLGAPPMPDTDEHDEKPARPKGKRRPGEDRARHPMEDR